MKIIISRSPVELPNEIVGIMFIEGIPRFVTLENRLRAIPPGTYKAKRDTHYGKPGYSDNYEVWELQNVPGRTQIQIHIGNSWRDSSGCILLGKEFNTWSDDIGIRATILASLLAHKEFITITKDETEIDVEVI